MPRRVIVLASVAIAAAGATAVSLPSKARSAPDPARPATRPVVAGAFHVHTNRSDGSGSVDDVARAAAAARLGFVVLTDHGDGTAPPLTPVYRSGVLVIDGVEVSTTDGHYAAVGVARSPYPLAGEGRDVAEDVRRLGGFGVAAHGESWRTDGQWRDWAAPVDGLEWLNLDASWRDAPATTVARGLLSYWLRPPETLASMIARPQASLDRLDRLATRARTVALAATDAHGYALPSYDACFRTISTRVELDEPLSRDAVADAGEIVRALARGHHYTTVDALAAAPAFELTARQGGATAGQGDVLAAGAPVSFESRAAAPPGAVSSLLRDGQVIHRADAAAWRFETDGRAGAYRVEVALASGGHEPGLPWIVSNPIYVGDLQRLTRPAAPLDPSTLIPAVPISLEWHAEHDATSLATVNGGEPGVQLRYTLGPGPPTNQYSAAAASAPADLARFKGIRVTAHADRPLRVSIHLRADGLSGAPSWQRSLYLDPSERIYSIAFDDMRPVRPTDPARPPLSSISSLLILAGLVNGRPSSSGEIDVTAFGFEP